MTATVNLESLAAVDASIDDCLVFVLEVNELGADTFTTVLQVARFPVGSVALHVMVVEPILKIFPARVVFAALKAATVAPAKLYARAGVPQLSVAVALNSVPETV